MSRKPAKGAGKGLLDDSSSSGSESESEPGGALEASKASEKKGGGGVLGMVGGVLGGKKTPTPEALKNWLRNDVRLLETSDKVADYLHGTHGCMDLADMKHLSSKDIKGVCAGVGLKKAPAGKLTDAWKVIAGKANSGAGVLPDDGDATYIDHARRLLTQIYYRQNMYVRSAQYYDAKDLSRYLAPTIIITSVASLMGFASSSSLVDENKEVRTYVGLLSGLCGVVATTLTALRNAQKFDIKAEMFRSSAGQYRILATKLEQRIRTHRHLLNEIDLVSQADVAKQDAVKKERDEFLRFFNESYARIVTCQGEMKYFPPGHMVKKWIEGGELTPNPIDQPMAKFKDKGYKLSKAEKARALYMLTNAEVPYKKFQALPEVQEAVGGESKKGK